MQQQDYIHLIKENENYRQDLLTRLIYHSNKIEGTTLTLGETEAILWEKDVAIKASARDFFDVINHKKAIEYLLKTIKEPLSIDIIKQLGIIINENINEVAGFRTIPVMIRGAEDIPPKPAEVFQLMMQTLEQYDYFIQTKSIPVEEREAWFHLQYEHIHPFLDGNGRTGRLLMLRGVLKSGKPPVLISSDDRTKYIDMISAHNKDVLAELIKKSCEKEANRIELTIA